MILLFTNNIGELTTIQRGSFYSFLLHGINKELKNFINPFPIYLNKKKQLGLIYIYSDHVKLEGPFSDTIICIDNFRTYGVNVYISAEYLYTLIFNNEKKQIVKKIDLFLGQIPLMTEDGTFIINGCEKIVINQIIRSPGVYFSKEKNLFNKIVYNATIISDNGLWTKISLDFIYKNLNFINNKIKDFNELNNLIFYVKTNTVKNRNIKYNLLTILSFLGISLFEILDNLNISNQIAKSLLKNIFQVKKNLKINSGIQNASIIGLTVGELGRYNLNNKLGLNLPKNITFLTNQDLISILNYLLQLYFNNANIDDIDDLKYKRIRSIGDLLQMNVQLAIHSLSNQILKFSNIKLTGTLKNIQINNNNNSDIVINFNNIIDSTILTTIMHNFFNKNELVQFLDQNNPIAELTHKRRISLFGPNGLNPSNISISIRDLHPSQYSRFCPIDTPEGQNAGLINSLALFARINMYGLIEVPYLLLNKGYVFYNKKSIYLNSIQEENNIIAFGDIYLNKLKQIDKLYILTKQNIVFSLKRTEHIKFLTLTPFQIISIGASIIPFFEHNDANRTLMGANMQRQAVPLLYTQKPLIFTGLEIHIPLTSSLVIKSYCEGKVIYASSYMIQIEDNYNQIITYYLSKYYKSNQKTVINNLPIVWIGEKVFSGQIIADGPSTNDGELSVGHNLLIAYLPWEGYNYEDSVIINERLVFDDCLTSLNIYEYEMIYTSTTTLIKNCLILNDKKISNLNEIGIIKIGSYVKPNDILIGQIVYQNQLNTNFLDSNKLINILLSPLSCIDKSLYVSSNQEGRILDIKVFSKEVFSTKLKKNEYITSIIIYIGHISKLQIGDKIAGRHGNKGIISKILCSQDMPFLPDGTPIDIIFNPLGIPSRMNVGQIFECLCGFASEKIGFRFQIYPFDEIYGTEASRILVYQKLKEASLKTKIKWIYNYNYPGKILLKDGRTGEYFDNPILVGKSYILKLIHLVEMKVHSRSTGAYSLLTQQPLRGKSLNGGQRFGEMEVWALEAYGCSYTLQELFTIKSDDINARQQLENNLITSNINTPINVSLPEMFLVLLRHLNALGLDFQFNKINFPNLIKEEKNIFKILEIRLKLCKYSKIIN